MVSEATLTRARMTAAQLRQRGDVDQAQAIEALIAEAVEEPLPTLDLLTTTQAGELVGVTGQTIKNWVRDGRLAGYRVGGRIMIPKDIMATYVERARTLLDLEPVSDEEAARLVAEGRRPSRW